MRRLPIAERRSEVDPIHRRPGDRTTRHRSRLFAGVETSGGDGTCQVLQGELLEVDVVSTSGVVSGVFVVVEIGRSSGDHDEVTVEAKSMAPDEMAIMPFEVIGAVPSELPVAYALTGAKTDEPTPHSR